jgi:hypothetical protein
MGWDKECPTLEILDVRGESPIFIFLIFRLKARLQLVFENSIVSQYRYLIFENGRLRFGC